MTGYARVLVDIVHEGSAATARVETIPGHQFIQAPNGMAHHGESPHLWCHRREMYCHSIRHSQHVATTV